MTETSEEVKRKPTLILTRGVPASGKSTWAKQWVEEAPNRVRVSFDDIRHARWKDYTPSQDRENWVANKGQNLVLKALKEGKDVVMDATNLNQKSIKHFYKIAAEAGADLTTQDFPISKDEAVRRNAARAKPVPEADMERMFSRLGPNGEFPYFDGTYTHKVRPFKTPLLKRHALIVDMDGSLHDVRKELHFVLAGKKHKNFDAFHRRSYWLPANEAVKQMVLDAHKAGLVIVITTAREERYREITQKWLDEQGIPFENMLMRRNGDNRADYVVKAEMYKTILSKHYDVVGAIDDNPQAVRAWEEQKIRVTKVPWFGDSEDIDVDTPLVIDNVFARGGCIRCGRPLKSGAAIGPRCAQRA